VFCEILSSKNSFAKTSSALFRHLPEYLEGRTPKRKMSFPYSEKIGRAQIKNRKQNFSVVWRATANGGGAGQFRSKWIRAKFRIEHSFLFYKIKVIKTYYLLYIKQRLRLNFL